MWGLPYTKNFRTRYHQKTWTSFKTESEPFYKIKVSNINLRQDTRLQFLSRKLVHRRVVGRAELNDFEPFELEPLALLAKEFIILSFFFFESFTWQSYVRATKIFLFFHCDYWCSNELRLPGWGQLPRRWDQLVTLESGPSPPSLTMAVRPAGHSAEFVVPTSPAQHITNANRSVSLLSGDPLKFPLHPTLWASIVSNFCK